MVIIVAGVAVALLVRAFWRQIVELAIICLLVAVFVGIVTLVELGQSGMGS